MKSKCFDLSHASGDNMKQNRTFDFVNLYKSAADTSASWTEKRNTNDSYGKESHTTIIESSKRERSPNKRRKKEMRESIEMAQLIIEGPNLNISAGGSTPLYEFKSTSTPVSVRKNQKSPQVKSIMKVKTTPGLTDDTMEDSNLDVSKSKKRNKSVSFMLEDNNEVMIKKTKSDDSTSDAKTNPSTSTKNKKHLKKVKKYQAEKENKLSMIQTIIKEKAIIEKRCKKAEIITENVQSSEILPAEPKELTSSENVSESKKKRKPFKKPKKLDENTGSKDIASETTTMPKIGEKTIKLKKKKQEKHADIENEEPVTKSRKKNDKPDVVADLENLSIGDNAHTLTNLLDEMTIVDIEKRKKLKLKFNKNKKQKGAVKTQHTEIAENGDDKVKKWRRRKWNKDTKAYIKEDSLGTIIIVENLPLSILFSYKKLLADHFVKYGLIKSVGIAEVYPTEVPDLVFTTTINFYSDGAASEALQEDKTTFEGSCIRVKRSLPPTATTLVVRSYGALTPQYISSVFNGAGRIRNIRNLVKGKHAMLTFFIEFDGPESIERALKLATDAKVGGKKIYVSRFETRPKKKHEKTIDHQASDADHSDDSQG